MFNQLKSFFHTNSRVYIKLENLNSTFGKKLTNQSKFIFIDNKVNNIYDTLYILNKKIDTLQRKLNSLETKENVNEEVMIYKNLKVVNEVTPIYETVINKSEKKKSSINNTSLNEYKDLLIYTNSGLG